MNNEVINELMNENEIINFIDNIDDSIKNYNTYKVEENRKKLEQKKKELEDLLSTRKSNVSNQQDNELGILNEKISAEKNNFFKEKNRLNLVFVDVDNILLSRAKENLDRKKLQAPNMRYSYGEIKIIADKINNNGLLAKIMKLLKINGYNSNLNMAMELLNRINSSKIYMDNEIKKLDEKYRNESQQIKEKYAQLSSSQRVTQEEEQENEDEISRLEKEFEEERENFIKSLRIKENFDNLDRFFKRFYFKEKLYEDTDKLSNDAKRILFGTVSMILKNENLIKEMENQEIISSYNFIQSKEDRFEISIPILKDINSLKLLFDMSDRTECLQDNDFTQFLREICYRYMRAVPLEELNISYIDPEDRGSNAGFLQKMAVDNKCKVVNPVCTSEDLISNKIIQLEKGIDEIIKKMMEYKDVKTYNQMENEKIPYQLVIINDFPNGFTNSSLEKLKVIIKNAQKCGISLIISRDMKTYSESIEKYRDIGDEINQLIEKEFERFFKDKNNCYSNLEHTSEIELALSNVTGAPTALEKAFVEAALEESKKVKAFDNSFAKFKEKLVPTTYRSSVDKEGLKIPFAINNKGELVSLTLSGSSSNALLSGNIGSGKSTTLHSIITSIITNYHPDDVELWLVDYKKVEFAEYVKNRPPHIKVIGLDKSVDFSYSLLKTLKQTFDERMDIFRKVGVSDISEYRAKYPDAEPMPRIVLIIDEFHNLTQAIQSETEYMIMLENALSEYRAFGFSCILSDQAISDGLRGLSDKARQQIISRLAMHNEMPEVKETLSMNNSYYTEEVESTIRNLTIGDVIFKQEIVNEASEKEVIIDKYKVLNISNQERENIINELNQKLKENYKEKDVIIVDTQERKERDEAVIEKYESKLLPRNKVTIPLYLGTSTTLEPCFVINLYRETDANVMLIGSDEEMRFSIMINTIKSFIREKSAKVNVFIDNNNEIYSMFKDKFEDMENEQVRIYMKLSEICEIVKDEEDKIINSNNINPVLNVWVGFEEWYEQFLEAPEKSTDGANNKNEIHYENDNMYSGLLDNLDAIAGKYDMDNTAKDDISKENDTLVENNTSEYNALEDISTIIKKGTKRGIYTFMIFDSVRNLNRVRTVRSEDFEHKIAFNLSLDDANMFLGRMNYVGSLGEKSAIYTGDGSVFKAFTPYK